MLLCKPLLLSTFKGNPLGLISLRWDLAGVYRDCGVDNGSRLVRLPRDQVKGKILRTHGFAFTLDRAWLEKN